MAYDFWRGVSVVEWGEGVASAFCGRLLADMGARVVKVEPPGGDAGRRAGPFPEGIPHSEKSGLFLALNANKLGITLNPLYDTGREIFLQLVQGADVLVHDRTPEDLERWRLTYPELRGVNQGLVMTSITPFGTSGPYQGYKATDLTLFHMCGYARSTVRNQEDPDAQVPMRAQADQVELVGGLSATLATSMALLQRTETESGASIDVSLWEAMCMMGIGALGTAAYQILERVSPDAQVRNRGIVAVLKTRDGYIAISPREKDQWVRWIELIGSPSWATEPRFATRDDRSAHWDELEPLLVQWTSQHTKEEVYHLAQAKQIPAFPMNTVADLFRSRHLTERGVFRKLEHPVAGALPYPVPPFRTGEGEVPDSPAPQLGEHTAQVLGELGIPGEELAMLRAIGVL